MAFAPVSVVIPCYLCDATIKRAVESVWNQTMIPAEVILVEDSSPDSGKTLETLKMIQEEYPQHWIKVIPLPVNNGPSNARNIGWEAANHPYIAFLDADDTWHSQKIEIQYNVMENNPQLKLSGHPFIVVTDADSDLDAGFIEHEVMVNEVKPIHFLMRNLFCTPSVMLRRSLPYRFEAGKKFSEDYQLWLEILLVEKKAIRINAPLAQIHKAPYGEGGLSGRLWQMEKGEISTYVYLYNKKLISKMALAFLMPFSLIKFSIRFLKSQAK